MTIGRPTRLRCEASGIPPTDDHESAIVRTLDPGAYTVVMRGKNNSSGIGVVETYDIGLAANARLANLSSRGLIGTGDNVLIGGFFAGPQTAAVTRVVFRAIGPSLSAFNVPQAMQDPTIELRDRNGHCSPRTTTGRPTRKPRSKRPVCSPTDPPRISHRPDQFRARALHRHRARQRRHHWSRSGRNLRRAKLAEARDCIWRRPALRPLGLSMENGSSPARGRAGSMPNGISHLRNWWR